MMEMTYNAGVQLVDIPGIQVIGGTRTPARVAAAERRLSNNRRLNNGAYPGRTHRHVLSPRTPTSSLSASSA